MILKLYWTDSKGNEYHLGNLYKLENEYCFDIIEVELKNALRHGCFGIGNMDISKTSQRNSELFEFFKNRIPKENELTNEELLEIYGLDKYNEMEILKISGGKLLKDRYFLEE